MVSFLNDQGNELLFDAPYEKWIGPILYSLILQLLHMYSCTRLYVAGLAICIVQKCYRCNHLGGIRS